MERFNIRKIKPFLIHHYKNNKNYNIIKITNIIIKITNHMDLLY